MTMHTLCAFIILLFLPQTFSSDCSLTQRDFTRNDLTFIDVPRSKVQDRTATLCSEKRQLSCCNKQVEEKYKNYAALTLEDIIKNNTDSSSSWFKKALQQFDDIILATFEESKDRLKKSLHKVFNIPKSSDAVVNKFYSNINEYSKPKFTVNTEELFSDLFVLVLQNVMNLEKFEHKFSNCVRNIRTVQGKPFRPYGRLDKEASSTMHRSLATLQSVRKVMTKLNEYYDLLRSAPEKLEYCKKGMTQVRYCARCHDIEKRPCLNACLTMARNCLNPSEKYKKVYPKGLEALRLFTTKAGLIQASIVEFDKKVGDAILNVMDSSSKLYVTIKRECGASKAKEKSKIKSDLNQTDVVVRSAPQLKIFFKDALRRIKADSDKTSNLPEAICRSYDAVSTGHCWDGRKVSKKNGIGLKLQNGEDHLEQFTIDKKLRITNKIIRSAMQHLGNLPTSYQRDDYRSNNFDSSGYDFSGGYYSDDEDEQFYSGDHNSQHDLFFRENRNGNDYYKEHDANYNHLDKHKPHHKDSENESKRPSSDEFYSLGGNGSNGLLHSKATLCLTFICFLLNIIRNL
ncbi:DgyrCDS2145 [Dimorphilus gyrociliatus]|uniref:DgyrCDS2145 n=1 Tax=Dimorphilus gyrociliatus TaxID=2664684 RepID=A0A7I8V9K4_9ANNE|nr:DgyrCDS2145 [Dimorphilus gyrociliatus]